MQWSRVIPEICARHGSVQASHPATIKLTDAINRLIKNIGNRAELPLPVHFHMLRHSCGYKLANDGIDTRAIQDWPGHVSITHTTRYTQLSPARFKDSGGIDPRPGGCGQSRRSRPICRIKRGPVHTAAGREYDDGGSWSGPPLSPIGPISIGTVSRIHRGSRLRPDAICRARDELWRHPNVQNETIAIFWRRNLDTVLIREHYNRTLPEGDSLCVRLVKR